VSIASGGENAFATSCQRASLKFWLPPGFEVSCATKRPCAKAPPSAAFETSIPSVPVTASMPPPATSWKLPT